MSDETMIASYEFYFHLSHSLLDGLENSYIPYSTDHKQNLSRDLISWNHCLIEWKLSPGHCMRSTNGWLFSLFMYIFSFAESGLELDSGKMDVFNLIFLYCVIVVEDCILILYFMECSIFLFV
ncbi:hypothetical protein NE237_008199 [Protea cynaroides]|uniref:Uncharacterized protein n=1 Tax=Protea cynaroides TaxID=273540 RepID=A0A9Q0QWV4_9MAGN|nr:hypothetical protein NE237_008199 [Protea cynaroides]